MLAGVDDKHKTNPVVVTMLVMCGCGHAEDDTYEFDMPLAKAQAREEFVPGKCSTCGAPVQMHLKRTRHRDDGGD